MLEPGGRREPAAGRGPDRGPAARRGRARHRQGRPAGRDKRTEGKIDNWDDSDYEYFFGDYLDDGYRPRVADRGQGAAADREHAVDQPLADRPPRVAAVAARPTTTTVRDIGDAIIGNLDDDGLPGRLGRARSRRWGRGRSSRSRTCCARSRASTRSASPPATCRSASRCRSGTSGSRARRSERIVTEHLRLLQNHQIPELSRKLGLPIEELKSHIEVIQHLDPKPGVRYNLRQPEYVDPRRLHRQGRRAVRRGAQRGRPAAAAHQPVLPPPARQGPGRRRDARLRQGALQRRPLADQVGRAAAEDDPQGRDSSIINFQSDFLDHGIEHLRPLVLRDVANDIGMHESTVSRVVTNKYMHTPQGVFEMKFFFHSGISSSYGDAVSSVTIKQRIRKIIEAEDPKQAAQRLEDREHPAARGPGAGAAHDRQVPRGAADPDVESAQGAVLSPSMRVELSGRKVMISRASVVWSIRSSEAVAVSQRQRHLRRRRSSPRKRSTTSSS